ncbi:MAG: heme-binding protein [Novosphingobium sp.]
MLDAGGHAIALQRQDGASILRPQIATAKAASALGLGISSRKIADMAAERPVPAAGGLIGISGQTRSARSASRETPPTTTSCAPSPALQRPG